MDTAVLLLLCIFINYGREAASSALNISKSYSMRREVTMYISEKIIGRVGRH